MSPQFANRMVDGARGALMDTIPDVYIDTDLAKGKRGGGQSPGYGLSLYAETTSGCYVGACRSYTPEQNKGMSAEAIGEDVSQALLNEVCVQGCVDVHHQVLLLVLMAMTPSDVSKAQVGRLSAKSIKVLRLIRKFLSVVFKFNSVENGLKAEESDEESEEEEEEPALVVVSCVGAGLRNLNRRVT